MTNKQLKEELDEWVRQVNCPAFIENDPVQFPRRFTHLCDVEIMAFIISAITWGKRPMILRNAEAINQIMNHRPLEYILSKKWTVLRDSRKSLHRTFKECDLYRICLSLHRVYSANASLEAYICANKLDKKTEEKDIFVLIDFIRNDIYPGSEKSRTETTSACKRINLFLKWMIRDDRIVDIGCWKSFSPSQLLIPLDTHVAKTSRHLGLLSRKQDDKKAVLELTAALRQFSPEDPTKYDFALFEMGRTRYFE